jgi:ribosomal protein S21
MSKSKHGATTVVTVNEGSIDYALKKFLRVSNGVISEYKRTTDHYDKPSSVRHQLKQSMLHKLQLEKDIKNGKVFREVKQPKKNRF